MRSMRLVGLIVVAAAWIGLEPSRAEAATAWSANGASCVPVVGATGVQVAAGAVTAGAGVTVTLYCAITRTDLVGAFRSIEITYKGRVAAKEVAREATNERRLVEITLVNEGLRGES